MRRWLQAAYRRTISIASSDGAGAVVSRALAYLHRQARRRLKLVRKPPKPGTMVLEPLVTMAESESIGPRISILMPVYNTPPAVLREAINSVLAQTYPNWELCICDDASTSVETRKVLEKYGALDWRIRIYRSPTNQHIAGATNAALTFATGAFVGFLDHDDVLEQTALAEVVGLIQSDPQYDLVYTDEDKITADGRYTDAFYKPDWSPDLLSSFMYILHFTVIRKSLVLSMGGLRPERTGAQDYDLVLRCAAQARKIGHVPKVLYHWRMLEGSAAADLNAKPEALINAGKAALDHVRAFDPGAKIRAGASPATFHAVWPVKGAPPVELLILTDARRRTVERHGEINLVEHFVTSIVKRSTYPNYRITVVDNGNLDARSAALLRAAGARLVHYSYSGPFSYADKVNFSVERSRYEHMIVLNDDLEVISPRWIEEILGHLQRDGVGAVGAQLLFETGRLQHAGVVLGPFDDAAHLFYNQNPEETYFGLAQVTRDLSAVTGAVLGVKRSTWRRLGGFDPTFSIYYNDIDFCLRVRATGLRIVYTPFARLYHYEGSSVAANGVDPRRDRERAAFLKRWDAVIKADPYYNPNLPDDRVDCVVEPA